MEGIIIKKNQVSRIEIYDMKILHILNKVTKHSKSLFFKDSTISYYVEDITYNRYSSVDEFMNSYRINANRNNCIINPTNDGNKVIIYLKPHVIIFDNNDSKFKIFFKDKEELNNYINIYYNLKDNDYFKINN